MAKKTKGAAGLARDSSKLGAASKEAIPAGPMPLADAASAMQAVRPEPPAAKIPADAPPPVTKAPFDTFRLGNRSFSVTPRQLGGKTLDILPDLPDIRDRIYLPTLRSLRPSIYPSIAFSVRDQGQAESCTGFALAHVIDCLVHGATLTDSPQRVSARMLYEMAKRNDEWAGTAYDGSSVRGAINGFYRNGVCVEDPERDAAPGEWVLTYEKNKAARDTRLGAYYRLQPDLSDYHAALNETGVIYVSAQIHQNWEHPVDGLIEPGGAPAGGHAFAIVGYDATGFWILNSWGSAWGNNGIAHWRYEDWAATMMDAWVLQLGVRAPTAFSAMPRVTPAGVMTPQVSAAPNRSDIVGHFINIDDGRYVTAGRYASPTGLEMAETVRRLTLSSANSGDGYDHLVIYAHGGLNSADDEANRIATWQRHNIFGRNKIYNFHLMWNSGFLNEVFHPIADTQAGRAGSAIGDFMFETGPLKALGTHAWRDMKQDAATSFADGTEYDGGFVGLAPLLSGIDKAATRPMLHLVGHSAGAIMLGRLLEALKRFDLTNVELGSIHLMAPACTVDLFKTTYGDYLDDKGALKLKDKIYLYCLNRSQELVDTVGVGGLVGYSHSLLCLVSRAYEEVPNAPIAGMETFMANVPESGKLAIDYSPSTATASTSHGGFDNDVATLSTIMARILGHAPSKPPVQDELTGY